MRTFLEPRIRRLTPEPSNLKPLTWLSINLAKDPVATRPQTIKSLCFRVIPGSVMLTHTVLEGFYNRVAITHLLHRMSQKRTYYNNMD